MDSPVAANILGTLGAVSNHTQPFLHLASYLLRTRSVGLFRSVTRCTTMKQSDRLSVKLIPQIVVNYRRHNAIGLQPSMMMLWAWAGVPLGVYNIVKEFNIALRIQPQILTLLSLATWIQCYYYERVSSLSFLMGRRG